MSNDLIPTPGRVNSSFERTSRMLLMVMFTSLDLVVDFRLVLMEVVIGVDAKSVSKVVEPSFKLVFTVLMTSILDVTSTVALIKL